MLGYIYKCTFKNKIYIGESVNALNPKYLGTGKLWTQTITGNEKEVSKEILETIEAGDKKTLKQKMHEREIYWIAHYDSTNPKIGYNISPGGNLMTDSSRQKMIEADSKTMKKKMEDPNLRKRISEGLKKQRREIGMSKEHRQRLSNALKGRNVGCNGDSRSIQVYCIVNNQKYSFHNKVTAAKWWFDNYPFSNNYAEVTYTRAITKSINNQIITYKGKPINQNIQWFMEDINISNKDSIYCIFNNIKYDFDNINQAAEWWHKNYPITDNFDLSLYKNKIEKSIKGYTNMYKSIIFDKIQWYRKEQNND